LPASAVVPLAKATWWQAFGETSLDRLQALAHGRQPGFAAAQETELARAYVTVRVQHLRAVNAQRLVEALKTEREALGAAAPTREGAQRLAQADERSSEASQLVTAYARERDDAVQRLLQWCGDGVATREALQLALDNPELPAVLRQVPLRLPASVLLSRRDVAELGRLASAHSPVGALLSGWIGPAARPAPLPLVRDGDASAEDALQQAGQEVAWSLRVLTEARRKADAGSQRLEARQLELMAAERRQNVGDAAPLQVLQAFEQLLAEADNVALAHGMLALAWIDLQRLAPASLEASEAVARNAR
jgi:outer membrane protein TolC